MKKFGDEIKTKILKSTLCDYSDAFILVKRTKSITGAELDAAEKRADERNKQENSFTKCISEISYTQGDRAKDLDVVMLMYNLLE